MTAFEFMRLFITLVLLLIIGFIFVASYQFSSPILPTMTTDPDTTTLVSSVVDKHCKVQLVVYLFENAPQIVNTFGWLWIRFYIAYRFVDFVIDEIVGPIAVFLAKKTHRAFCRYWFANNPK
ncbi:hypothetical protein PEX2_015480 [Penicillium expansum]|uniref:Uncharacterized protein n=1 Tax=Penicillium expansum TaxID=27334 RepID=A0A0A2K406_PENEN|nr:hypothetical protein PEX2_015480 [Penicillium expansum]KGO40943.1 hypothetical protein PEXP_087260 [Penicillium expansum]KGO61643.1 hypothetical protein PEX2_015480 [Penicillium expansum]